MIVIYTGGSYDLFHSGHVNFLKNARLLGDYLVVALNRDEFISRFKRPPICNYKERYEVLSSCVYVDEVIENSGNENSGKIIEQVMPNIIAIGDDWKNKDYLKQLGITQEFLEYLEIDIEYIPYTKNISTTEIIRRIKNYEPSNRNFPSPRY